jgi:hypothetical protein
MTFDNIYDQLLSVMSSTFPDRSRLIKPYRIEDNNGHFLKSGYGVEIGPMVISDTFRREIRQIQRTINISLTERVHSSDQKTTARETDEKLLISDQETMIIALKNGLPVEYMQLVGDEGIEEIFDERDDYIRLRTNFVINYNQKVR